MMRNLFIWTRLLLIMRVPGAAQITVTAVEGDNVTLSDGSERSKNLSWLKGSALIAVRREETTDYFGEKRDDLHLESYTGSLSINNVSRKDSGDYEKRDFGNAHRGKQQLNVTDSQVAGVDPRVGETFTFHTNFSEVQECSKIIWNFTTNFTQCISESHCLPTRSGVTYYGEANLRLHLSRIDASLTITDLKITDSGIYEFLVLLIVKSTIIHLIVYAPISQPVLKKSNTSHDCSVLCTVKNEVDVILSWYRGNERVSNISSLDLQNNLTLPLNIMAQDNSTYHCVASNPVGNLTIQFNKDALCPATSSSLIWTISLIAVAIFVGLLYCGIERLHTHRGRGQAHQNVGIITFTRTHRNYNSTLIGHTA